MLARASPWPGGEAPFRTAPFYETASEKHGWLNRMVAVGVGRMAANWVGYSVYAVLQPLGAGLPANAGGLPQPEPSSSS